MPGYSGHLPSAQDHHGSSHVGGVPLFSDRQRQQPATGQRSQRPQSLAGIFANDPPPPPPPPPPPHRQLHLEHLQPPPPPPSQLQQHQPRQPIGHPVSAPRSPLSHNDWNGTVITGGGRRSDEWPHNRGASVGEPTYATETAARFYTPPPSQPQTPKAFAKPSQRGGTGRDIPGYGGHRQGARDLTDREIGGNIDAFGGREPSPSQRERPTIVGTRMLSPSTPPTSSGRGKYRPAAYLTLSPSSPPRLGSAGSLSRQPQQHDPWQRQPSPPEPQRTPTRPRAPPSDAGSEALWEEAMHGGARPSFERATPQHESYRYVVGGIKAGYSGHVPARQHHVGSAAIGGSITAGDDRVPASQRDHSGTRLRHERVAPRKELSQKAAESTVGYRGTLPGERDSLGGSYWGAWAAGVEPELTA